MVYSIYQEGAECIFHINGDSLKSSCVAGACGDFFGLVLCPTVYPLLMQPFTEAKRSWCLSGELVVNVSGHWVVVVLAHLQVVVVDPRDGSFPGGVAVPSGHDV